MEQLPRFTTQKLGILDARYEFMNRSEVPKGKLNQFVDDILHAQADSQGILARTAIEKGLLNLQDKNERNRRFQ